MITPVNFEIEKLLLDKGIDMPVKVTIAEVTMWLYEKHGIWISISIDVWNTNLCEFRVIGGKDSYKNPYDYESHISYNSPIEAYEAAIEYTLKNLI